LPVSRAAVETSAPLDDAEQPEDEDENQQTAKTDIHDTLSCFCVAAETVDGRPSFQSLRRRDAHLGYHFTQPEAPGFA
jgi:hypothetical protein